MINFIVVGLDPNEVESTVKTICAPIDFCKKNTVVCRRRFLDSTVMSFVTKTQETVSLQRWIFQ